MTHRKDITKKHINIGDLVAAYADPTVNNGKNIVLGYISRRFIDGEETFYNVEWNNGIHGNDAYDSGTILRFKEVLSDEIRRR